VLFRSAIISSHLDKVHPGYAKAYIRAQHGFEGWVTKPTMMMVGEKGPEHVSVTPQGESSQLGAKGDVNIHLSLPNVSSIPEDPMMIRLLSERLGRYIMDQISGEQ